MEIKGVGVKMLRDNLSRYLKEVRTGTRILILDRDKVVAELHEPTTRHPASPFSNAAEELAKAGKLIRPQGERILCTPSPVRLREGTAGRLIDEDRTDQQDVSVR